MTRETPTVIEKRGRPADPEGELPARFEYVREIARGGMGRVLEVFDRELQRTVALKLSLTPDDQSRRHFEREVAITARLEHPAIVPVYDGGRSPTGEPYYVMRRIGGAPLDERVRRATTLDQRLQLLPHVLQMADAVAHAHQRGIVHRDLKPSNVLVGELGETIVIDWGLAKRVGETDEVGNSRIGVVESAQTQVGSVVGTPGFMAPEQALGDPIDVRCDVYALGASLYYVLGARLPITGSSDSVILDRTLRGTVPDLAVICPGVPPELAAIATKAMAIEPNDRYLDAGGFAEELRRFLEGQLVAAHRYSTRERIARWVHRRRGLVITIAVSACAVIGIASFAVWRVLDARSRAERALDSERERGDELVVSRAHAYAASDPTRAAATLIGIRPESPLGESLRGLRTELVTAGIPWGYPGHDRPASFAFAPSGAPRVLTSGAGRIRLITIETRQVTQLLDEPSLNEVAAWAGELVVVGGRTSGTILAIDPHSGRHAELAWPSAATAMATAPGLIAFVDQRGRAALANVRGMDVDPPRALDLTGVRDVTASPSGQLLVVLGASATTVLQREGEAWSTHLTLPAAAAVAVADDRVALSLAQETVEISVAGVELQRCTTPPGSTPLYAGTELLVRSSTMLARCAAHELTVIRSGATTAVTATHGLVAALTNARDVELGIGEWSRTVHAPLEISEVALDSTGRWLFASAASQLLAWDLERVRPTELQIANVGTIEFLDSSSLVIARLEDHTLVVDRLRLDRFQVERLATLPPETKLEVQAGVVKAYGRAMIVPPTGDVHDPIVRDGTATVVGTARGGIVRDGEQIATLTASVDAVAASGGWLAASTSQQLWRHGPTGASTVAFTLGGTIVVTDRGVVVVAVARELYMWDGWTPPRRVATATSDIANLHAAVNGMVALDYADGTLARFDPATLELRVLVTTNGQHEHAKVAFAANGTVAVMAMTDGLVAVDLAEGTSWTVIPRLQATDYAVAPDGSEVVVAARHALYRFPLTAPAALTTITNARLESRSEALTWR